MNQNVSQTDKRTGLKVKSWTCCEKTKITVCKSQSHDSVLYNFQTQNAI